MENEENKAEGSGKQKENNMKTIAGAIVLAGFLIAGAILLKDSRPPEVALEPGEIKVENVQIRSISRDEHITGNPDAEIIIVEYSDTECPFCKRFHETMQRVVSENQGKVAWAYRHYPIPELHAKAFNEALATECAWEQGGNTAFWQYTDELYARTQSNDSLDAAELPLIAGDVGLDVPSFNTCLSSQKYASKVEADMQDGLSFAQTLVPSQPGLGTPTSLVLKDGKPVEIIQGALPYEMVAEILKAY